jgi:hypothetical protein
MHPACAFWAVGQKGQCWALVATFAFAIARALAKAKVAKERTKK